MKSKIITSFILGCVVTIACMVIAFTKYMRNERAKLYQGAETTQAIVANADLEKGTVLEREVLALRYFYTKSLSSHSLTSEQLEQILDKELQYPVQKGEPILTVYIKNSEPIN